MSNDQAIPENDHHPSELDEGRAPRCPGPLTVTVPVDWRRGPRAGGLATRKRKKHKHELTPARADVCPCLSYLSRTVRTLRTLLWLLSPAAAVFYQRAAAAVPPLSRHTSGCRQPHNCTTSRGVHLLQMARTTVIASPRRDQFAPGSGLRARASRCRLTLLPCHNPSRGDRAERA